MKTGLSAIFYIRNNKKRVLTLILCIALFSATLYIIDFLFGTSEETFYHLMVKQTESIQLIVPNQKDQNIDFATQLTEEADLLKKESFVEDAVPVALGNCYLKSIVGQYSFEMYLAPKEYMERFCEWNEIESYVGTLPKKPGELFVEEKLAKNCDFVIGEKLREYTITAIGKCDNYTCFGIPNEKEQSFGILIHSDGKDVDFKKLYQSYDETIEPYLVIDNITNKDEYETEILSAFKVSSDMITVAGMIILAICLVVLYILYIRERQEEWCLYQSIGYSNFAIYLCAVKEMLFVFLTGICIATVAALLAVFILDITIVKPLGLLARYFNTEKVFDIFCVQVGIFGICNLPVLVAIHKIKTVDAIESDEW